MHQGPGNPESVRAGDDKIIDICVLVCAALGQGSGDTHAADKGELEKKAGSFFGDGEHLIGVLTSPVPFVRKGGIVLQGIEGSCPEQTSFFYKRLYFFPYGIFIRQGVEEKENVVDSNGVVE